MRAYLYSKQTQILLVYGNISQILPGQSKRKTSSTSQKLYPFWHRSPSFLSNWKVQAILDCVHIAWILMKFLFLTNSQSGLLVFGLSMASVVLFGV